MAKTKTTTRDTFPTLPKRVAAPDAHSILVELFAEDPNAKAEEALARFETHEMFYQESQAAYRCAIDARENWLLEHLDWSAPCTQRTLARFLASKPNVQLFAALFTE